MANCRKCGAPLTKGNIKVIRRPGKRAVRECRRCPESVVRASVFDQCPEAIQGPQDTREGPVTWEGEIDFRPPRYRYFMTADQAERIKRSLERQVSSFGVGFEVIPVLEEEVERNPDVYGDLVEVTVDWKVCNE